MGGRATWGSRSSDRASRSWGRRPGSTDPVLGGRVRWEDGSEPAGHHDVPLSEFLRGLASAPRAWTGERSWESLEHELRIGATCDPLGHVGLAVSLAARADDPSWWATARGVHALGDLAHLADAIDAWFAA